MGQERAHVEAPAAGHAALGSSSLERQHAASVCYGPPAFLVLLCPTAGDRTTLSMSGDWQGPICNLPGSLQAAEFVMSQ